MQIKENIKVPRHWPLGGEFTGDPSQWIPRKCFHLKTSRSELVHYRNGKLLGACSAPSYYLPEPIWLIVIRSVGIHFSAIRIELKKLFIHENAFETVVCEMVAILSRGRWVKYCCISCVCRDGFNSVVTPCRMGTFRHYWPFVRGNPPVTGGFPVQRVSTGMWSFGVFLYIHNPLNKQSCGRWFETQWRSCNVTVFTIPLCPWWQWCKDDKQRVLMHGHQGWNVRHGLCHIYMRYVYIYELFIAFVSFVVSSLL